MNKKIATETELIERLYEKLREEVRVLDELIPEAVKSPMDVVHSALDDADVDYMQAINKVEELVHNSPKDKVVSVCGEPDRDIERFIQETGALTVDDIKSQLRCDSSSIDNLVSMVEKRVHGSTRIRTPKALRFMLSNVTGILVALAASLFLVVVHNYRDAHQERYTENNNLSLDNTSMRVVDAINDPNGYVAFVSHLGSEPINEKLLDGGGRCDKEYQAKKGDTIIGILLSTGCDTSKAYGASNAIADVFDPTQLKENDKLALVSSESGEIEELKIVRPGMVYGVRLDGERYRSYRVSRKTKVENKIVSVKVDTYVYSDLKNAGIPEEIIASLQRTNNIKFDKDIRPGDTLIVKYSVEKNEEGASVRPAMLRSAKLKTAS